MKYVGHREFRTFFSTCEHPSCFGSVGRHGDGFPQFVSGDRPMGKPDPLVGFGGDSEPPVSGI